MKTRIVLLLTLLLYAHGFSQNPYTGIALGELAPPLSIYKWVQGDPVNTFAKGKIYVVEFSGTWCPPCRKAIPHLTELNHKYKAIEIISIYNELARPGDSGYDTKVIDLLKSMGSKMDFTVAVDNADKSTAQVYKVKGYPTAFVINKEGKVIWKGDPFGLDSVLEQVSNGTFDMFKREQKDNDFYNLTGRIYNTISKGGSYFKSVSEVNKLADSLMMTNPDLKLNIYFIKFDWLASVNTKAAYNWASWLIQQPVPGFDWPHFMFSFDAIKPEDKNFKVELATIDRVLSEDESVVYTAKSYWRKALTYELMKDYKKAVEFQTIAVENSKAGSGDDNRSAFYLKYLIRYTYEHKMGNDRDQADNWLKQQITEKVIPLDEVILEMLMEQNADQLAIDLIDSQTNKETDPIKKASFYSAKSDVFLKAGNNKSAVENANLALETIKSTGIDFYIDKYQEKLELLKNDKEN